MISEHELMTCLVQLSGAFPDRKFDDRLILAYRTGLSDLEEGYLYLATQEIIKTAKFFPRISEIRAAHENIWQGRGRQKASWDGEIFERLEKEVGKDRRLWNKVPKFDQEAYKKRISDYWETERSGHV